MNEAERVVLDLLRAGAMVIDSNFRIMRSKTTQHAKRLSAENTLNNGYVRVLATHGGRQFSAMSHRVIWQFFHGEIRAGMQINHKNGIRHDNQLANLEVVTPSENMRHAYRNLGRTKMFGAANGRAKLTPRDVEDIRRRLASGEPKRSIARDFGVSATLVRFIGTGKLWPARR